ncbi:hypothetical protein LIER_29432 [Lithospermum erythrorhizon]|uniref:FAD-binding PCMH-type domain-containing protein n=1 Tax=Lithospermum erythrorhizon TaxID=34254 RepID=A0AAV3RJL7_LITER
MVNLSISLLFIFFTLFSSSSLLARATSSGSPDTQSFLQCLSLRNNTFIPNNITYTQNDSSYSTVLNSGIFNLRFASPSTPKPLVVITPIDESQVPPVVECSKEHGLQIRIRSGGHDYEGASSVSQLPFVILDLLNLRSIDIDVESGTAWVQSGAIIGELYYRIAEASPTLAFPAGVCPTLGIGGHFAGGAYGTLLRKHGLGADHIIDAHVVDANGRILDRESMGEDLFWALRGGGGASFGVILSWKVNLVPVPETVTVFSVQRTLQQNGTELLHHWQSIAHDFHEDLFVRVIFSRIGSVETGNATIGVTFNSLFLGGVDRLLSMMQESFPELGLVREDCEEMSWVESTLYFNGFPTQPLDFLLNRTALDKRYFKAKSDYVTQPIPLAAFEGIWNLLYEEEAAGAVVIFAPYGGRMNEISKSAIPFPHRAGNLYSIQHLVYWNAEDNAESEKYITWMRKLYRYFGAYVSKSPRAAYINYKDYDLGQNNLGNTSFAKASIWGTDYFNGNFKRLAQVKAVVDPGNFFRNEQSIPPLYYNRKN